jgi:hypothetical protein
MPHSLHRQRPCRQVLKDNLFPSPSSFLLENGNHSKDDFRDN